jgi:hypothetical protein
LQRQKLSGGTREFLGDFSTCWLKIKALRVLGLEKFMEPGKVWSQDSPEIVEVWEQCKKKAIAKLLGDPGNMKPMQWLNCLLKLIGCKLINKNVKRGGVQHREYFYVAESSRPANWDELVTFTAEKQAKKISEINKGKALAAQKLEAVAPPFVFDTKLEGDVTPLSELSQELEPQPQPVGRMGWVSHWGKWVRASFLAAIDGSQYRMLIEQVGGWSEVLVFPHQIRWEEGGQSF